MQEVRCKPTSTWKKHTNMKAFGLYIVTSGYIAARPFREACLFIVYFIYKLYTIKFC